MRSHWVHWIMVGALGFAAGCSGGGDAPPPPPPTPNSAGGPVAPGQPVPGQPVAPAAPIAAPNAGGASNFGTVTLTPGFTPDPHVARGTSGGAVEARTLNQTCRGWVSSTPDHIFVAGGNFTSLRILAASAEDVTLVVQRPDGQYMCNDDAEGRNPIVTGLFPPGAYKVWIGSYTQGRNSTYRLGFTELSHVSTRDAAFNE